MDALDLAAQSLAEPAEHGLSQMALEIARPFGFPITNSMIVTWIVAVGLIVFAQRATRTMTQVPGSAQNFLEWIVESVYGLLESIIGQHLVKRTFWFFGTIFIFILATNWVGLVPGVGTIGWGHQTAEGFTVDGPLFRGANADLNMTLAMALILEGKHDAVAEGNFCMKGGIEEISDEEGASVNASMVRSLAQLQVRRRHRI